MATSKRQPGSLRLVTKTAKGKTYKRWQWRTHRRTDTGWTTVDVELGESFYGLRTRVLVALGELKAPLLVERWARWHFLRWDALPAYTGRPLPRQRAAWWFELPRTPGDPVRLRFRSLDGTTDFRSVRSSIRSAEEAATAIYEVLSDDPIRSLALLQWFEQQGQQQIDKLNERQIELRRQRRRGELTQRDYEADERTLYASLHGWEDMVSSVRSRWDELLQEMVAAMPRTRREADRTRIVALADRHFNDARQRKQWQAEHWIDNTLHWSLP